MPYPTWLAGERVTAQRLNELVLTATKTSGESVVSSTVLQNDNELVIANIPANSTWTIDAFLVWQGNETGDIKFAFAFTTPATVNWAISGGDSLDTAYNAGATRGRTQYFASANQTSSPTGAIDMAGSTSPLHGRVSGLLANGSSASTLQLMWAQNTSNATSTTVLAGSWLRLTRGG